MLIQYKGEGTIKSISTALNNLFRINKYYDFKGIDWCDIHLERYEVRNIDIAIREIANSINKNGKVVLNIRCKYIFDNSFSMVLINRFFSILEWQRNKIILIKNNYFSDISIDSWTFGIITAGKRNDYIKKIVSSIEKQNIPNYEIIICGNTSRIELDYKSNIHLVEFKEQDDLGWITRKKNIIIEKSSFKNICILHDRYVLSDSWYSGFLDYGGDFDVISLPQTYNDRQLPYWVENSANINNPYDINEIKNEKYWSKNLYMPGGANVFKKSIAESNKYNENLYWQQKEDIELSRRHTLNGYMLRLNNKSSLEALFSHWKDPTKLGLAIKLIKKNILELKLKFNGF
ncbi:hypothetical protein GKR71_07785 [Providencia sp. wls1922]|uniref:glycosyltransferase family 2 protein n=1 Tax=Providencia sp. wls1922 TaxID=2675152 RepID=UPI0012B5F254|nr:hypothetical protein [Providencia sp. wls1922]